MDEQKEDMYSLIMFSELMVTILQIKHGYLFSYTKIPSEVLSKACRMLPKILFFLSFEMTDVLEGMEILYVCRFCLSKTMAFFSLFVMGTLYGVKIVSVRHL